MDNLRTRLKDATKTFKDVLTLRTENLKNNQNRRKMFSSSDSPFASRGPPLLPKSQPRSSQNPGQAGSSASTSSGPLAVRDGLRPGGQAPLPGGIGQSMQQQLLGPMEDTYMNSRAGESIPRHYTPPPTPRALLSSTHTPTLSLSLSLSVQMP